MPDSSINRREKILEGNILKNVWFLSWPIVLQNVLQTTMGLVDLRMVNHLGHEAIAAVGIGRQVIMIVMVMVLAIQAGATAVIARKLGERDNKNAESAAGQAILMVILFAAFFTPIGIVSSGFLLWLMGAESAVQALGVPYMQVFFATLVFFMGNFMVKAIFHGTGNTKTPLYINIIMNLFNFVANLFLIYGIGFFPELGVTGAALGTALSRFVGMSLGIYALNAGENLVKLRLRSVFKFSLAEMKEILRIGTPTALQGVSRNLSTLLLVSMVTRTAAGSYAAAAFPIGMKVNQLAIMPGLAIGQAATTMVGMNLGNKDSDRAEESGWMAAKVGCGLMTTIALINFIMAPHILRFFTNEPEVVEIGSQFIRIIAVSEPFHAIGAVLSKGMQGAGYTMVPFYLTTLSWLIIRVPLAYLLAFPMAFQSTGVWISMNLTYVLQAVLVAIAFKRGRWKETKLKAYSS